MAPFDFDEVVADVDGAAEADDGATDAAEDEETEPELEPVPVVLVEEAGVPSGADAMAAAWNAAKVLLAVGLMAKTMPFWQ
jgi:hypothetical protein